ncbi:Transcription initiation factor [Mycena kentingensis (nom. inval.)]|nr:Transcription initiation factor [Mycena kentingensis (nom. inval.)]
MAPNYDINLLFHKKTKPANPSPPKKAAPSRPRPKPAQRPAEEDDELKLPDGPFQEFKLLSSALNGWKYDVMKFDSRKPTDLTTWHGPIKLNRKELRRDDPAGAQVAVGPMLGLDGKPVVGHDGKIVMVDAEGKPIQPTATAAQDKDGASGNGKGKGPAGAAANGKKKFQKKTRQVYVVPEEVRQLRREERYPWVMEDATGNETWTAQLEDVSKSATHAFFMPAANDVFKFVPAHRWYKFQKKMNHENLPKDTLSMESAYSNSQKRDPGQWLYKRRGQGPSQETAAMFKAEEEGRALSGSSSLVHSAGQSMAPGGRRTAARRRRRRDKERGAEGDLDEQEYEEDFADDDEKVALDAEDEEMKDVEERLKKEYKTANKQRDGHIDESDDEVEIPGMTKQAKRMQKLIRNREGNDAYDSDDDKNPYASSEESEDEEVPIQPVILNPPVPPQPAPDSRQPAPGAPPTSPNTAPRPGSGVGSRATSPSLGGHSVVAKRATSPKANNRPKVNGASRSGSPLASGSRAASPASNSRATSPVNGTTTPNGIKKRKAEDYPVGSPSPTSPNGANAPPKPKKRKGTNGVGVPAGELEDHMVINWLKNTVGATTRDCIAFFQPYLTDDGKKQRFTALIKEVAHLKNGVLALRPGKG